MPKIFRRQNRWSQDVDWMWEVGGVRDDAQDFSWGDGVQGRQPWVVGGTGNIGSCPQRSLSRSPTSYLSLTLHVLQVANLGLLTVHFSHRGKFPHQQLSKTHEDNHLVFYLVYQRLQQSGIGTQKFYCVRQCHSLSLSVFIYKTGITAFISQG